MCFAKLSVVMSAPGPDRSVALQRQAMRAARRHCHDVSEADHLHGRVAPGPHGPIAPYRQALIATRRDGNDVSKPAGTDDLGVCDRTGVAASRFSLGPPTP